MKKTTRNLSIWAIIVLCLLMIPKVAMQYSNEVNWDLTDFVLMGSILFGMGVIYEFISRKSNLTVYRAALAVAILSAFLLFWVNAAVGIIGSEDQPANLLFGAVFIVGLAGVAVSRFRAKGMSKTMFAAAIVQMLVPIAALLIWPPSVASWAPGIFGVFMMCGFFATLFVVSALLFRHASDA
ncbi:MAG: hypothetical protein HKN09_06285 [Saprospiraceae bacterium]|nr:hypothetical protein [Saprospiraceae bacterium]